MILAQVLSGRDNNFNLLRFIAAFSVVIGHIWVLKWGINVPADMFETEFGYWSGVFAVNAFFVMSGLLVAKSLLSRRDTINYLCARGLRIFPALIVMASVLTFILGPLVSHEAIGAYLFDFKTAKFWALTASAASSSAELPGVMANNPFPYELTESLWTLKWEIAAYVALLGVWLMGLLKSRRIFAVVCLAFFSLYLVASLAGGYTLSVEASEGQPGISLLRFGGCFLFGALCYLYRDLLPLSGKVVLAGLVAAAAAWQTALFDVISIPTLGYAVIWLALVPAGAIRKFNRIGDYSYGIYIYHCSVIQTLVFLNPAGSVIELAALTAVLTLAIAIASWHLVEKPALSLLPAVTQFTKTQLQRFTGGYLGAPATAQNPKPPAP